MVTDTFPVMANALYPVRWTEVNHSRFVAKQASPNPEPPDGDPHVRWCGSREGNPPGDPIRNGIRPPPSDESGVAPRRVPEGRDVLAIRLSKLGAAVPRWLVDRGEQC